MDCTLCWLPGYYFLKLGFMAALWHPNMQLAVWIYERSVGPLLGSYEVSMSLLSLILVCIALHCFGVERMAEGFTHVLGLLAARLPLFEVGLHGRAVASQNAAGGVAIREERGAAAGLI
jgi:hypothetical protein